MTVPAIELRGITKHFPGVLANDDVNIEIAPGSIHAIVGENGAGKTTLMKILYGLQSPDSGTIRIDGAESKFKSPRDAIAAGIGMVHQHFQLMDNLSVSENIVLGAEPTRYGGRLDLSAAADRIRQLGSHYGIPVDPDAIVSVLSVGQRQRVEILKVLFRGARFLILDEPTAVLVPQEADDLLVSLEELSSQGVTIIFINHKLDEVLKVADKITVMRAGKSVATVACDQVNSRTLAEMMVGYELPTPSTESVEAGETLLEVTGLTAQGGNSIGVEEIDLRVRRREIVGIAGVEGNGQNELIEALLGLIPSSGAIKFNGIDISNASTQKRRMAGIGVIPQDRHRDGLLLDAPLWENVMLGHQTEIPFAQHRLIDRVGARSRTVDVVEEFGVRTPGIDVAAHALSGGNQQKLIIGRELKSAPSLLIAAHPTRGIDVGAQVAVWDQLRAARRSGLGLLLISADLEELIGLADRLLVMLRGRIVAELDPKNMTPSALGLAMLGESAK